MARNATGQVVEPTGKQRSWAIRFRAYGKRHYVSLGRPEDGWDRRRAEDELANVLADVRRGIWQPPERAAPVAPKVEPTFHEFATDWLNARRHELRPRTVEDYQWALEMHLLPFFAIYRLSAISVEEVDRYKTAKAREGKLSAVTINKTLKRLCQILDVAEEYGHIDRNPARGRRRRLKESKPRRSWVEPEQLMALLDGAPAGHRPILATLAGAGLRVGEAVALDWRDVNLATGTLTVRESKTDAGTRTVDLPGGLLDELKVHKACSSRTAPAAPVFATRGYSGEPSRQHVDNVRRRLKTAIKRANPVLVEAGVEEIADRVSPHSLRRTYASLRAALRDDPVYIAEQLGHTDPGFTFRVYQKAAKRRERLSGSYLAAYDRALHWAEIGQNPAENRFGSQAPTAPTLPNLAPSSPTLPTRPRSSAG